MKTIRILFVAAMVLSLGLPAEAKKVKLQYQLKAGDQFKYELSVKQEILQEVMGQSQATTLNNSHTYEFKVIEAAPDGSYLVNVSLVAVSMSMATPMGDVKFNSESDTVTPEFAKSLAVSLNEIYSFKLSPLGKVSDVKAPEGIVEKVNKTMEGLKGSPMQMAAGSAGVAASAEGFQKTIENMVMTFPDGGAETKKPWEEESKTNQMISFKVLSKCELIKSSDEANEISVKAQIIQDPDSPPMEMEGMNLTYELAGAKEGVFVLETATGLIKSAESTTSISGTISVDSPQLQSPMSIPMTIRSTEKVIRK